VTPADTLATNVVLTMTQVAEVLHLCKRDGTPDRRKVMQLVDAGRLRVIDPTVASVHWRISTADLLAYINGAAA